MSDKEKYDHVFAEIFPSSQIKLGSEFSFKDVPEWDSVSHLSLISELEDTFDIMLETEEILHFGSYENGKKIMKKYGINI